MSSNTSSRKIDAKYPPYPYKALPSGNWIRILYLDAADNVNENLTGQLEQVDLNDVSTTPPKRKGMNSNAAQEQHNRPQFHVYEALSWCWGSESPKEALFLRERESKKKYRIRITPNLAQALKSLRNYGPDSDARPLWVDAVCINMENKNEQAHQVAQMSLVYSSAWNVCIWLDGQPRVTERYGYSAKDIFSFIEDDLLNVAQFDVIVKQQSNSRRWLALIELMTKKWFSRRWVIQEIALSRRATIHCGDAKIKWEKFAHAVILFIKAESANRQLSAAVHDDKSLDNKSGVFRDIDRMGAASLVDITATNFKSVGGGRTRPVSSLESLMAMLPMFEATEPCDTIFSLLAIAKDVRPETENAENAERHQQRLFELGQQTWKYAKRFTSHTERLQKVEKAEKVAKMIAAGLNSKPYIVSYSKPPIDVYQYFVKFCIYQSRSLDIICRPWAPKPEAERGSRRLARTDSEALEKQLSSSSESDDQRSSGYSDDSDDESDGEERARFAGLWQAHATARINTHISKYGTGDFTDFSYDSGEEMRSPPLGQDNDFSASEAWPDNSQRMLNRPTRQRKRAKNVRLAASSASAMSLQIPSKMPTWIADRQNAAFKLVHDKSGTRLERTNADPLVGSPEHKPYRASGTRKVRIGKVRFLRRSEYDHSLFVEGFILDRIEDCQQPSDLSNIPSTWFDFVDFGNNTKKRTPPDDLYRTLIADRGLSGTKPPKYFPLAYREALNRDRSITLDSRKVIDEEKRSIVTEFLERVRQVIHGRSLAKLETPITSKKDPKTKKSRLALVPRDTKTKENVRGEEDLICILYGLSVPVVLRKHVKSKSEKEADRMAQEQQLPEAYQNAVRCIERFWSFRKELEKAIYSMTDEETKSCTFSRLWCDKIKADFDKKARESEIPTSSQNRKPERLEGNRAQEVQDRLWKEMCDEWEEMLKHGKYANKSDKVNDTLIKIPLKEDNEEYYEVIGEAYIDQMMDGEALLYKRERNIPDTVFELR